MSVAEAASAEPVVSTMIEQADAPGLAVAQTKAGAMTMAATGGITARRIATARRPAMFEQALAESMTVAEAKPMTASTTAEVTPVAAALAAEPSLAEAMAAAVPLTESAELAVAEPARLPDQAVDTADGVFHITTIRNRRGDHHASRPGVNGRDLARNHVGPTGLSRGPRTGGEGRNQNHR
jgi:hypothetical protein